MRNSVVTSISLSCFSISPLSIEEPQEATDESDTDSDTPPPPKRKSLNRKVSKKNNKKS